MKTAEHWIETLGLQPHPEGGYYREVYRSAEWMSASSLPLRFTTDRCFCTSIYFLLRGCDVSHFHRIGSDELWFFHAGDPLTLHVIDPAGTYCALRLDGTSLQIAVPHGCWFGATVDEANGMSLVGCSVSPGFEFSDFELATRAQMLALCPAQRVLIERLTLASDR
jgi:predicted cupin superfamily sugar epimerase